jgi:hypothetical protein
MRATPIIVLLSLLSGCVPSASEPSDPSESSATTEHAASHVTTTDTTAPGPVVANPDPAHIARPPETVHAGTISELSERHPDVTLPLLPQTAARQSGDASVPIDMNSTAAGGIPVGTLLPAPTPQLPAPPAPSVPAQDPPAPPAKVCTAHGDVGRCPPDLPNAYSCPASAQPIGCERLGGALNVANRIEECCP